MVTVQINEHGQITLPADLLNQLGLKPGDPVQVQAVGNAIEVRGQAVQTKGEQLINAMRGRATAGLSTDQVLDITRSET